MFFDKKYVYSESVFNSLYIDINTNLKATPLGQNKRYEKGHLFFSRAPTHHSFTFNL